MAMLACGAVCAESSVEKAAELAMTGRHAEAARIYLTLAAEADDPVEILKARLNAASCMKLTGDISAATRLLADSNHLLEKAPGNRIRALFMGEYGALLAMGRKPSLALPVLEDAARLASDTGDNALLAEVWNDLGIARAATGDPAAAYEACGRAMSLAKAADLGDLLPRARQNRLLAAYAIWKGEHETLSRTLESNPLAADDKALRSARDRFEKCLGETPPAGVSPTSLFEAVTAGIAAVRYGLEEKGFGLLEDALEKARASGQDESERAALLALAELYTDHGRRADAMLLLDYARETTPADSPFQQAAVEILFARCEMLPGGDAESARLHSERAIRLIEDLRGDLAVTQPISDLGRGFREWAGLPYRILADLDTREGSPEALARARQSIESYKAWELDDFYRDDCVNLALERSTDLGNEIPEGVAVIYVIALPDRTEILVGTSAGLAGWKSPVGEKELDSKVRLLRHQLEFEWGFPSYLETAGFLYESLLRPCVSHLRAKGVRHIVFVPEGPLAAIPLGVLRDSVGGKFLAEEFGVSVSPGLSLSPNESLGEGGGILLAGVSAGVQGFSPLPGVGPELAGISALHGGAAVLLDAAFTKESLAEGLIERQATTIHLASHAEFSSDADETFLLTHAGRITMDELEAMIRPRKFTGQPVDLLCLSACRTAAGDERAALGLAGAAIKSGARSVVASLWYVDDEASGALMTGFHRRLKSGNISKAQALREAQLELLRSDPYIHPNLWAPFILIGDWR